VVTTCVTCFQKTAQADETLKNLDLHFGRSQFRLISETA